MVRGCDGLRGRLAEMTPGSDERTSSLDEWRAEVGDDAIAALVQDARDDIADGSLSGFSDRRSFLDHLASVHPRSV